MKILGNFSESIALLENLNRSINQLKANEIANAHNINQYFLVIMGILVMFMHSGFGFLEAGNVRPGNVTNSLIKNVLDLFISAIVYWVCGWAFAYGDRPGWCFSGFIGGKGFFSTRFIDHYHIIDDGLTVGNDEASWFFQMVFAATISTIVNGAIAERVQFRAYLICSAIFTGLLHPILSHWAWSSTGWLGNPPGFLMKIPHGVKFKDFAGSGVVHVAGGIAALVGAIYVGPRAGRFEENFDSSLLRHRYSVPFMVLGSFILFMGFLAFNGGCILKIVSVDEGVAEEEHGPALALSAANTIISGSAGGMAVLLIAYVRPLTRGKIGHWSIGGAINGCLAGMVAACAGCNDMPQWAAFLNGMLAGFHFYFLSSVLKKLLIDDLLDAFPVHFGGGVVGILLAPIFTQDGIWYAEACSRNIFPCDFKPYYGFAWNVIGLIAIILFTLFLCLLLFGSLSQLDWLRVCKISELMGCDNMQHGGSNKLASSESQMNLIQKDGKEIDETYLNLTFQ